MNIVAIIQARMGSTRLPGKVMLQLIDKSVLAHVVDRSNNISLVTEVVVATSTLPIDDAIEHEANQLGVKCYRGSENDVLGRYHEAAVLSRADVVVRITSDCPLLDPELSNEVIQSFMDDPVCDYCTNTLERRYPRGLDLEVVSFPALKQAHLEAKTDFQREHVLPFIYGQPQCFKLKSYVGEQDYSMYRWTLDTIEDWQLIQQIYCRLYVPGKMFRWQEAINVMEDNPHLFDINKHIEQKKS